MATWFALSFPNMPRLLMIPMTVLIAAIARWIYWSDSWFPSCLSRNQWGHHHHYDELHCSPMVGMP